MRKICQNCKEPYKAQDWEREYLGDQEVVRLFKGKGCEVCTGSGYLGRTLVYEILVVNEEMAKLIGRDVDLSVIRDKARESGFRDIFQIAAMKVKQGVTTTQEMMRVLGHVRQN